ncbi:MAG: ABC transporter ATP-binding protein [Cyanobium sp.]
MRRSPSAAISAPTTCTPVLDSARHTTAVRPPVPLISQPPLLLVEHLSRCYGGGAAAVDGVSFSLAKGELLALLGPSGCGKTTTLRLIAGFERADQGVVRLNGQEITHRPPEQRGFGLVFQDYALFPHLTVAANVGFGLHRLPRGQARVRVEEMLALVGLAHLGKRYPHELSGGQQQRVALARTLAPAPALVLLDEPFSNLDAAMRVQMRQEVRQLFHQTNTAAILVTHDQEEAMVMADRLALMERGRLVQIGQADAIYRQPATAFVANFLGRANVLEGQAHGERVDTILGDLPLLKPAQGYTQVAVRPEQIRLVADPAAAATVEVREFRGHDQLYRVRLGDEALTVITPAQPCLAEGCRVQLQVQDRVVALAA